MQICSSCAVPRGGLAAQIPVPWESRGLENISEKTWKSGGKAGVSQVVVPGLSYIVLGLFVFP